MAETLSGREPIRVVVVDDSAFMRKAIRRMLEAEDDIEVVETIGTGEAALDAVLRHNPDVITLDIVLPGIDGLTVLEQIMAAHPVPVLMLSSLTTRDAEVTLNALEKGAVDVVAKPAVYMHMDMPTIANELVDKIRAAAGVNMDHLGARPTPLEGESPLAPPTAKSALEAVIIGASTGGPPALTMLVNALPADFPAALLLVQHMPPRFTAALAERLDHTCRLPVKEASDGDLLTPGRVYVARSGKHIHFARRGDRVVLQLNMKPGGTTHVPSIDVAMDSAAQVFGDRAMGILLTGMGDDGARGLLAMREAGAYTVAEAQQSAVIWGMPGAAVSMGSAAAVLPLEEIPARIFERVDGGR
ncbi:MAG: chemotaxis response regulator protein-glutamate methylesterase [Coriobacteriia bacterium]|nr:chemotaxis response regulator protein-glutamate methylesterase [Coriobacteriia bacterium]